MERIDAPLAARATARWAEILQTPRLRPIYRWPQRVSWWRRLALREALPKGYRMMLARQDWLLLALSKSPGGAMTPVQIQKAMFLFGQEAGDRAGPGFYSFQPYDYGPFDAAIYADLRQMASLGHVRGEWNPDRSWKTWTITASGRSAMRARESGANPRLAEYLGRVVTWVGGKSFPELLRSVYAAYPQFAVNSVFREP